MQKQQKRDKADKVAFIQQYSDQKTWKGHVLSRRRKVELGPVSEKNL